MGNKTFKTASKIKPRLIIAILLLTITIGILIWNHNPLAHQNDNIEPEFPVEEPIDQQPNPEPDIPSAEPNEPQEPTAPKEPETPNETQPPPNSASPPANSSEWARVRIGDETYFFNPLIINSTRPDLFNQGQFSMFDILVHLNEQNKIELEYHFDETMNTHIIDTIDGETGWWYETYYSGGWPEQNVLRPDHYPWKLGTNLRFYKESNSKITSIYSEWQQEIQRKENNNGKIIIPEVLIQGATFTKKFNDVEVTPHNLRNDTFQENVITAIDVILSLADQGRITYKLQWYDSIGIADVVRSYWVEAIDHDEAYDTCGFVYEAGSQKYRGFAGNHIHLPSDTRILNSPEYVAFFWICL